jgi:hypothetical protein
MAVKLGTAFGKSVFLQMLHLERSHERSALFDTAWPLLSRKSVKRPPGNRDFILIFLDSGYTL